MYTEKIEQSTTILDIAPIKIVLAESDQAKIEQVICFVEKRCQASIRFCKKYSDLLPMLAEEIPALLLLGMFDELNSFALCREFHEAWKALPIIMISRQAVVDEQFRRAATTVGAIDVVSNNLEQLDGLFLKLLQKQIANTIREDFLKWKARTDDAVAQNMLEALQEITAVGNKFLGPLAQGNYWRKTHDSIKEEFPFLHGWSASHFGVISCNEGILRSQLTEQDLQGLRRWVHLYVSECERVVVDFRDVLSTSDLSFAAVQLLPAPIASG